MESESSAKKKKRIKRRRTNQPFKTKRFKFTEDYYIYYWQVAVAVSVIASFFLVVIFLYIMLWLEYVPHV